MICLPPNMCACATSLESITDRVYYIYYINDIRYRDFISILCQWFYLHFPDYTRFVYTDTYVKRLTSINSLNITKCLIISFPHHRYFKKIFTCQTLHASPTIYILIVNIVLIMDFRFDQVAKRLQKYLKVEMYRLNIYIE